MKTIKDIDVSGRNVLVRVDFNVPLDEDRKIVDDARMHAVLPTLTYALDHHAKLIIASHLGRPEGKVVPEFSMRPLVNRLGQMLGRDVVMAPDCVGADVQAMVAEMRPGNVLLLENLRFHKTEQENDEAFGKALAELCDVYVNDAFAVSHRVNASVVAITKYASVSAAGFLLEKELKYIQDAMQNPVRPLVAVIGGAKVSSKLSALENMMHHVNKIIIGGAMANTFIRYNGCQVGKSLVEEDLLDTAGSVMEKASAKKIAFYIPVDAIVADRFEADASNTTVTVEKIPVEGMIMDIGPATIKLYEEVLREAGTIIWNGPMGVFEMEAFSKGTYAMANAIAQSTAMTIVGGGETGSAIHQTGQADKISYISTGGGAFLSLLEGNKLPAVAALEEVA